MTDVMAADDGGQVISTWTRLVSHSRSCQACESGVDALRSHTVDVIVTGELFGVYLRMLCDEGRPLAEEWLAACHTFGYNHGHQRQRS